jgi:hypothetical protein
MDEKVRQIAKGLIEKTKDGLAVWERVEGDKFRISFMGVAITIQRDSTEAFPSGVLYAYKITICANNRQIHQKATRISSDAYLHNLLRLLYDFAHAATIWTLDDVLHIINLLGSIGRKTK